MSTLSDLEDRVDSIDEKVKLIASEASLARGDGRQSLDFLRDSPGRRGLNSQVDNIRTEIEFMKEREQERWQSVDSQLTRIEHNQTDLKSCINAGNAKRVHPAAVWFALLCAFAMAMSSVAVAGATLWWVFGKEVREEYAAVMGCEHP